MLRDENGMWVTYTYALQHTVLSYYKDFYSAERSVEGSFAVENCPQKSGYHAGHEEKEVLELKCESNLPVWLKSFWQSSVIITSKVGV